jgi:pyrimidine operon attenuation protein / uracil phosphoribosyltransferase
MIHSRLLYNASKLEVLLQRLTHQLIEMHLNDESIYLIGIQPRGIHLSKRIRTLLQQIRPQLQVNYGELDTTFFREDFRQPEGFLIPESTWVEFNLNQQRIVLVDDVLFTGRNVRAALEALLSIGKPSKVELLVLVDRKRMRKYPIEAHYVGIPVDTLDNETVIVNWQETTGQDSILIHSTEPQS